MHGNSPICKKEADTGAVKKEENDEARAEMWNTCNDMVIAWILGSVSESIKKVYYVFYCCF